MLSEEYKELAHAIQSGVKSYQRSQNQAEGMMPSYCYRLPWPPSVNHYWFTKGSRRFIGKRGKEFRNEVLASIIDPPRLEGRLAVSLEFTMPDRRKRDIDNLQKAALDALSHAGVYHDDCQIDELRVKRLHVEAPGACDVTITELCEPDNGRSDGTKDTATANRKSGV